MQPIAFRFVFDFLQFQARILTRLFSFSCSTRVIVCFIINVLYCPAVFGHFLNPLGNHPRGAILPDGRFNQSIKPRLSLWTLGWLIDWRKVNFDLIGLLDSYRTICFYGGGAKVTWLRGTMRWVWLLQRKIFELGRSSGPCTANQKPRPLPINYSTYVCNPCLMPRKFLLSVPKSVFQRFDSVEFFSVK